METSPGFTFLHDDCASCGAPVDVIAPTSEAIQLSLNGMRGEWFHEPSSARCAACALREASDFERPQLERKLRAYQRRKAITGLPDDATLYYVHATSNEIMFDQFFVRASGRMPGKAKIPCLYLTPDDLDEDAVAILFMAWDFATSDRRAIARYTWNAVDPYREALMCVDGWSKVPPGTLTALIADSRRFVEERQPRGRKPGRKLSREDILIAYRAYHNETGRYPKQNEVATALGTSPKTIHRIIGQPWTEFDNAAQRKTHSRSVHAKPSIRAAKISNALP